MKLYCVLWSQKPCCYFLTKWPEHLVFNIIGPLRIFTDTLKLVLTSSLVLMGFQFWFFNPLLIITPESPKEFVLPTQWHLRVSFHSILSHMSPKPSELLVCFQFFRASRILLAKSPGLRMRISEGHNYLSKAERTQREI